MAGQDGAEVGVPAAPGRSATRPAGYRLFVYGTLLDPDLRAVVLGRPAPAEGVRPAVLRGYRCVTAYGGRYPALRPQPRGKVAGALLRAVTDAELARLIRYEGEDYALARVRVLCGPGEVPASVEDALVFMARSTRRAGTQPWGLDTWRRRHKRLVLRRAAGWMAQPLPANALSSARRRATGARRPAPESRTCSCG